MSDRPSSTERKERTTELRVHHEPVFEALGTPDAAYIPKMFYIPSGFDEKQLAFFKSEITVLKDQDIYTEAVSMQVESEDENRTLYKIRQNPHYEEEFEKLDGEGSSFPRYLVPVSDLVAIDPKQLGKEVEFNIDDPKMDCPLQEATLRDLTAVLLKEPVSHKPWLNDIINSAKSPE